MILDAARLVIVVPATGWRSRRRSTRCGSSPTCSRSRGIEVKFAIHPVAGRMPGT